MLPLFDGQKTAPVAPQFDIDAAFNEFWLEWPRKTGKDAARAKYRRALMAGGRPMADTHAAIMDAVGWQKYKPTWNKLVNGERVYCPHPATWLHQGRYKDPMPPGFKTPGKPRNPIEDEQAALERNRARERSNAARDHQRHIENMARITSGAVYREFPNLPPGSMKVRPCDCWNCRSERGEV